MSTIEDFENAPVGATATSPDGRRTYRRETKTQGGADWANDKGEGRLWADADGLAHYGYTLGPAPAPAPTTAREALDLAWNLAHEVKVGQVITAGTRFLEFHGHELREVSAWKKLEISPEIAPVIRTLDPLPDPEPDWLDAPAVMAVHETHYSVPSVWVPHLHQKGDWTNAITGKTFPWQELTDVTPLYPKGQEA